MKKLAYFIILFLAIEFSFAQTSADELLQVHKVTTTAMNNIVTPSTGSLVFNTTENTMYFYTGTIWKKIKSDGDETIINEGTNVQITGDGTNTTPYTIQKP